MDEELEVGEETRQGLGEAGSVTIADSIWDRCVPRNLLSNYRRHLRRTDVADSRRGKKAEVLACMMEDVMVTTRGQAHAQAGHRHGLSTSIIERELQAAPQPGGRAQGR